VTLPEPLLHGDQQPVRLGGVGPRARRIDAPKLRLQPARLSGSEFRAVRGKHTHLARFLGAQRMHEAFVPVILLDQGRIAALRPLNGRGDQPAGSQHDHQLLRSHRRFSNGHLRSIAAASREFLYHCNVFSQRMPRICALHKDAVYATNFGYSDITSYQIDGNVLSVAKDLACPRVPGNGAVCSSYGISDARPQRTGLRG
jgi:hypothetical protein